MVDGSQGQVAKVAALPSGPHCLHCHGDDDDDDDDLYRHDQGIDDDIYIMMKCLSRKMSTFLKGLYVCLSVCNCLSSLPEK